MAKKLNRIIVLPIFTPHGTINNKCKKYYNFSEIFDVEHFKKYYDCIDFYDIDINIRNNIENIYNIRHSKEHGQTTQYFNCQKDYYNLTNDVKETVLDRRFIVNNTGFEELENINDDIIVLLGTFNSIKLSSCSKNGCLNKNCSVYDLFKEDYNYCTEALVHNNLIKETANKFINKNGLTDFTAFHLRTSDLIGNNLFNKLYNDLEEEVIFESIQNYMMEKNCFRSKIFLAAPPAAFKIRDVKIINSDKFVKFDSTEISDPFLHSIIETEILRLSKILIYSPTNTPQEKKLHTRSSFILHIKDQRTINKIQMNDVCIVDIYNNTNPNTNTMVDGMRSLLQIRIRDYNKTNDSFLPNKCDWNIYHEFIGNINIQPKTIFVKIEYIESFYNKYYKHIQDTTNFVLITGGADQTMPNQTDHRWTHFENRKTVILKILEDKRLIHWFAENCDELLPKMSGIPTGVFESTALRNYYNNQFSKIINFENRINIICCHRMRDWTHKRHLVNKLCENEWSDMVRLVNKISPPNFCNELSKYTFTICVGGEGDSDPSPKAFEAIISGSIPIIKKYDGVNSAYKDLPVVFIDDWKCECITKDKLVKWLSELRKYYEDPELRKETLYKLSDEYWWKHITSVC